MSNYIESPYKLYAYGDCLYLGRTYQEFRSRIKGHMNDALKGSDRLICQQVRHDLEKYGKDWVERQFTVIAKETSHDQLCALETSEIRRCRPLLNMTTPKKGAKKAKVTKSVRKNMIKNTPILKKYEKKYIKNKPKQTKSLIDKASLSQTFKNKQERLKLVKRISNQYPDWD